MIANPTLPEGWTSEDRGDELIIDAADGRGSVTIRWDLRSFCLGVGFAGPATTAKYTGRGWKERLLADAVAKLQSIWGKP